MSAEPAAFRLNTPAFQFDCKPILKLADEALQRGELDRAARLVDAVFDTFDEIGRWGG